MISTKQLLLIFRLIVGGVFIWSGVLKVLDPLEFAQNVANYQLVGQTLSFGIALVLPWIEILCGLFLILGLFRQASSFMISGLLVIFLILIVSSMIRGLDIECGCFGSLGRKLDFKLILTDLCLLVLSLSIFFSSKSMPRASS